MGPAGKAHVDAIVLQLAGPSGVWLRKIGQYYGEPVSWYNPSQVLPIPQLFFHIVCDRIQHLRMILHCYLILAMRSVFIIENPVESIISRHYRFELLTNLVSYVF